MPGALSTDLYEMTMAAGYHGSGPQPLATFELFVRELPAVRGYLVAAGLEQALAYLEQWACTSEEVAYLESLPELAGAESSFFETLRRLRFCGNVWAVPEGVPVFAGEPLVRVTAPLLQAQLVETALLNTVLFQTTIASKASRMVEAAKGTPVIEFGGRRAHGAEAAMYGARAACLGGCTGTSNLDAGFRFGVDVSGTMAHSWVMSQPDERTAFTRYVEMHGARSVLLIDTYDSLAAAQLIVDEGLRPAAVRLDSGDLAELSRGVRAILDAGGLRGTRILVSGDLDEYRVSALVAAGAPVDGFGVGTALITSKDAPTLSGVYKLVEIEREGRMMPLMKLSAGKETLPGAKQVWRSTGNGPVEWDLLGLDDEVVAKGMAPLLRQVMRQGRVLEESTTVAALRERCRTEVERLPLSVRRCQEPSRYDVRVSTMLSGLATRVREGRV